MRKNKVIYKLVVEDVDTVSEEILNRKLTDLEIQKVENHVGKYISWYDALQFTFSDLELLPNKED